MVIGSCFLLPHGDSFVVNIQFIYFGKTALKQYKTRTSKVGAIPKPQKDRPFAPSSLNANYSGYNVESSDIVLYSEMKGGHFALT